MALICNVGGTDKGSRVIIGTALAAYAWLGSASPTLKASFGVIAAIALGTAVVGFCPLNRLLRINTCNRSM